jgi:predicted DNA-binding ribbon-helix-helix protein
VLDGPTPVAPGAGGLGLLREDPAHRFEPFPLTDIQHAYWIGRTGGFDMGNVAGHVFYELDATDLDLARLMGAWRLLISRHEMLRAVIEPDGTQRILERVPEFEPRVLDLRAVESREAERRLAEIRAGMSCQALQVDRWPLFDLRATLLPDRIRLHIDLDLLVADLASAQILLGDLIRLYLEPEVPLAPLALSFRDCVLATKAAESSEEFASARRYWLDRLDTLPPAPRLPLRVDPASVSSPRSRRRSFRLEAEGWRRLKERASRAGLTPSSLLAAAYAEVLHRWSGSPHFTINVTLFSRPAVHPEVGGIVGDFTSVNLLEVRFDGGRSFQERALALQQRLVTDLGHRQFSGVRVLRELARERASRAEAIMPVVFTSAVGLGEHGPEDTLGMLGTIVHSITQTPQVWLDYQAMEQGGGLLCNWDAVEELFPPGLLDDMFDAHSSRLLRLARAD